MEVLIKCRVHSKHSINIKCSQFYYYCISPGEQRRAVLNCRGLSEITSKLWAVIVQSTIKSSWIFRQYSLVYK